MKKNGNNKATYDVFNMEDYLYCGLSIQELK